MDVATHEEVVVVRVEYTYNKHGDDSVVAKYTATDTEDTLQITGKVTQINDCTRKVGMNERCSGDGQPSYEVRITLSAGAGVVGGVVGESDIANSKA